MLGKLIKYELLAEYRKYAFLYVGILFAALTCVFFDKVLGSLGDFQIFEILSSLTAVLFTMLCFAALFMIAVFAAMRFYKNMYRDEGYLMHTLPVKSWQHIAAKIIATYIWTILSVIVIILGICILGIGEDWIPEFIRGFKEGFAAGLGIAEADLVILKVFWWYSIAMLILYPAFVSIFIYFCISVGSLFNSHKILMAIVAFIGVNTVSQIVSSVGLWVMGYGEVMELVAAESVTETQLAQMMADFFSQYFVFSAIFCVILYGAMLFFTNFIMSKKLNLE